MNYWHKLPFKTTRITRSHSPCHVKPLSTCFQKENTAFKFSTLLFSICLALSPCSSSAQDKSINNGIEIGKSLEEGLSSGQAIWLNDGQAKFFTVFDADKSGHPKGGVIILHDANSHPDKPEVIRPLRTNLPTHGWPTVTIQLPHIASLNEYASNQETVNKRISSAIDHLKSNGLSNIALIGHGTGAMLATTYLATQPNPVIQAFVAVSLGMLDKNNKPESLIYQFEKIKVPILDIYGSNDLDHVTSTAMSRALAAKLSSDTATNSNQTDSYKRSAIAKSSTQKSQGYISYRQIILEGASHDFSGSANQLSKRIAGWLERHAKGVEVNTNR